MIAGVAFTLRASAQVTDSQGLRPPSAFADLADRQERSRALFTEASRVFTHQRCVNCHPATDRPTQGNDLHPHLPAVSRDVPCLTCHHERNFTLTERASYKSIPGSPNWHLAPLEMAWQGKSPADICEQMKDPRRNGGRNLEALLDHIANDDLVGWGWRPGEGREPAPGSQRALAELVRAWIDSGAQCPR
jgi:hypothetical protein